MIGNVKIVITSEEDWSRNARYHYVAAAILLALDRHVECHTNSSPPLITIPISSPPQTIPTHVSTQHISTTPQTSNNYTHNPYNSLSHNYPFQHYIDHRHYTSPTAHSHPRPPSSTTRRYCRIRASSTPCRTRSSWDRSSRRPGGRCRRRRGVSVRARVQWEGCLGQGIWGARDSGGRWIRGSRGGRA